MAYKSEDLDSSLNFADNFYILRQDAELICDYIALYIKWELFVDQWFPTRVAH